VVPFERGPEFSNEPEMAEIIGFDLSRSGQFAPLERDNMLSFPSRPDQMIFRDWRVLGMEYVLVGSLRTLANGNTQVRYHLFDVVNERQMLSDEVSGARADARDLAHRVSDDVFEAITGIRGAFSTKILYVLAQGAGSPEARYSLELADSDGERSRTLHQSDQPIMSPSWGPNGRRVAYVTWQDSRQIIVILDVATGTREIFTQFSGINGSPVFSPDGQNLLMVLSMDGNPEIYTMSVAERRLRRLTRHHAIDTEPSYSPDGRYVIFTSDRGGAPQIYRLELATNLVERLTFQGGYNARARLLPDGKHLVYVHRRDGNFYIAWQDLEREDVRVLTQTSVGLDESPSLAPNGTMLMYATQDRGRGILAVVSIDGRVKYRLPSSSGDVREPAWSPFLD
jgi:TolB protein